MVSEWLLLCAGVLLSLGTSIFFAAEFSLVALDRSTVERAIEAGDKRAVGVLAAVRTLSTQLSGAQVGITVTTLVVGYLAQPSLAALLATPLAAVGLEGRAGHGVAVAVALAIATGFSMVVGELIPKNLAISIPLATAKVVAGPQRIFTASVAPLITLLNGSANRLLRAVGVEPQEELSAGRSPEELAALVRHSAEAGTLEQQAADVVALARKSGHSRFPVIDDDLDDVVGIVHLKSAVAVPRERRDEVPVAAIMSEALRVPETVRLDPLLVELRALGLQLAVVVDEYGGTAGVVTLEDLVEEIVGEVADEHDRSRPGIVHRRDGTWVVPGLMRPDEVRERTGVAVPDGPAYETLGGFMMAALGRVA